MIALAKALLDRYLRRLPSRVDMIGALCARENLISHSRWMAFLTSSCTLYSCVSLFMTRWTFWMLGLCGSFTILLIRYHIFLLSSWLILCLIATIGFFCFYSITSTRQLQRCTFLSPLACFLSSALWILMNCRPSCSTSIVSLSGLLMC
jgi:hypothetical protein